MRRRHHPTAKQPRGTGSLGDVLAQVRTAATGIRADEPDAELPGVRVEEVRQMGEEFWRTWKIANRRAARNIPILITRRRRSKWLVVLAAEDLFPLLAAIRAVEDRAQ